MFTSRFVFKTKRGHYYILKNTFGVFCRQSLKITLLALDFWDGK
jgi:hypothetical protein